MFLGYITGNVIGIDGLTANSCMSGGSKGRVKNSALPEEKMKKYYFAQMMLGLAVGVAVPAGGVRASLVFQADFNGTQAGTGGASDVVTQGGTGSTTASAGFSSSVVTSSSLVDGSGGYLHVQAPSTKPTAGAVSSAGVILTPSSKQNSSFDSWIGSGATAGGANFVSLNGAFDFFYRSNTAFSAGTMGTTSTNSFRVIDTALGNAMGNNGLRLVVNNTNGN